MQLIVQVQRLRVGDLVVERGQTVVSLRAVLGHRYEVILRDVPPDPSKCSSVLWPAAQAVRVMR